MKFNWNSFDWEHPCALIILDSVGWPEYCVADTPNIDRIANHEFEAFTTSSFTGPSIHAMFLGYIPWIDELKGGGQVFGRELWLPESFRDHGYTTIGFASMPYCQSFYGFDRGFDVYRDMRRENMTPQIVDDALGLIKEEDKYFLFCDLGECHRPYDFDNSVTEWRKQDLIDYNYKGKDIEDEYLEYLRDRQIQSVEYLDEQLGPVLDRLVEDDAFIIISSDHGTCFGEGHVQGHGIGGEEAIKKQVRVPLVFHLP